MLQGKKILLGITGSIAAYKAALLVRALVKAGAEVKVIMTASATQFITPLTLSTLSKNEVLTEIIHEHSWNNHVLLGRWADILLIAPASANTIAKMAQGSCDNLLLAVYLSAHCPVLLAPAMDEDMWHHPATQNNLRTLASYGHTVLPVETGELASGLQGEGRMAEPETILAHLENALPPKTLPLSGTKVLVTAGPTYEPIDPVRFIGNYSSGKMGWAVAEALAAQGAAVDLVLGPVMLNKAVPANIQVHHVQTAAEMYATCMELFPEAGITVMAAAVADYRSQTKASLKIKKQEEHLTLTLEKTKDILQAMGERKSAGQILVGFALETDHEKAAALQKLHHKHLDMIILNSLQDKGAGFRHDTNKITIFDRSGNETAFPLQSKEATAKDIVAAIIHLQHA